MSRAALPILAVLACLPATGLLPPFWVTLANYAGIATIVALGLVVLTGYGGMTSFAQATFMGLGAYTTAILTARHGVDPWLALPAALAVSLAGALAVGAVTLRLSGHYLALGTIAWAVSAYYLFGNLDLLGRNDGISGIPPVSVLGRPLIDSRSMYGLIALSVALCLWLTRNLLDSRPGRAIRALRGGAAAAASFGVDLPATRLLAFCYAALLAGLAGWLYAHLQRSVNPTPFGLNASIQYLLMAVVGGAGAIWGALAGAVLVTAVNDQLQNILPRLLGATGNYEIIVFGALLVVLLQTAPAGLWPLLRRTATPRRRAVTPAAHPGRTMPAPGTPLLEASPVAEAVWRAGRCQRPHPRCDGGGNPGPHRPKRRRQVHDVQSADRCRPTHHRHAVHPGRPHHHAPAACGPPGHRTHVPAREAGARHVRAGKRGAGGAPAQHAGCRPRVPAPEPRG